MRTRTLRLLAAALALAGCGGAAPEPAALRLGMLPILDALPFYVADAEGLFAAEGLQVEFVPVASAAERDQLMQAGQIDGMINDLISTLLYNQGGVQIVIVRFARTATPDFPQYRILAAAGSGVQNPADLRGVPIGISEGTVIQYVTERLLQAEGLPSSDIATVAVPRIADRMSLLRSGELQAATLPDPLSTLAIQDGAIVVLDDTSHPEYGNSVLSFRAAVVSERPEQIRRFLAALERAIEAVNNDPRRWSGLLTERELVPAPLVGTYELPPFPAASLPSEAQWADVLAWAQAAGLIAADVPYAGSVDGSFLPGG